ncbi:12692_t:CDS:2 [Funneliformis caledonium]|uniref:12692_t:CDS:1 n=1 Tax=Funneliformis caledonium TaxID=1117310 RepID=A0A9N9B0E3_9GLOM|nr:12692_t:CDS:2 [Funneliformis caledonium]
MIYDIFVSLGLGILTYIAYFYFKYFTRSNPIPGPIPLPFIGNQFQLSEDISLFCRECQKNYGDIWEFYVGHPSDKTRGIGIEMEGYWKKLYGDEHNELDLSEWLSRLYTDNIFHITANKKVYAIMERISNETLTEPLTDEAIIGNFMETTAGGIDSITSSTCFISYFMAKYPEVKKRVFEEIDSKFTRDQKLTCEELNQLPYCDAVIREISRMHPIAELNYRVNAQEEILNGYVIPAETQIYIHQYGINMHKAHWTNPEEFNPDRFLNNRENSLNLTFGGGIRMCPGRNLAMMELKAYMVLMYRKYDFELVDKNAPLKTHYSIIRACDELKVRVKPRVF